MCMPRLCVDCLLAERPCAASHLLTVSARNMLSVLRPRRELGRAQRPNVLGGLKDLGEF